MTFWTVLLLTYGAPFTDYQTGIILPPADCPRLLHVAAERFLAQFPDGSMTCMATDVPYSSPRPKTRPAKGQM